MNLYQPTISGSLTVSGSVIVDGTIIMTSGSISGTASLAENSLLLNNLNSGSFAGTGSFLNVSSSFAATSGSLSTRVTNLEATSSVLTAASASFATTSGSLSSRVTIIEGQDATTGSNTFTGVQYISQASNAISFTSTASLYTDGGLRVAKDSFVSGTAYFNNVVVYGTSSIQYITSSQVNFGTNIITVNTDTPAVRFGGLAVFDSGSTQLTGSMLWDSEKNHWIYSNPSGSSYNSAMLMNGPRNTGSLGNEQGTTNNALMKGQGGDHITSSQMFDDGTTVRIPGNFQVTGSTILSSTAVTGSVNVTGSFIVTTTAPELQVGATGVTLGNIVSDNHNVTGSLRVSGSLVNTGAATFQTVGNNGTINIGGSSFYSQLETNSSLGGLKIKSIWGATNSGIIQFINGTAENVRMHIADNGNVGIGFATPTSLLYVSASGGLSQDIVTIRGGGGSGAFGTRIESNNGDDLLYVNHFTYDITMATIAGNVGIGTSSPSGKLDISSGLRNGTISGLFLGADADSSSGTRTNNTRKLGLIASPHYTNANRPVFGIAMDNQVSNNFIYIGGAYSGYNAATSISFFTGATTNTETGTERMNISSIGVVNIGNIFNDGNRLIVTHSNTTTYNPNGYNGVNGLMTLATGNATGAYSTIRFAGGGSHEGLFGTVQNSSGLAEFIWQTFNGSAYGERMRLTNNGQLLFSRTAASSTDCINIETYSGFSGRGILINMDAGNDALTIGGGGTQNAINVTSSGKKVIISNLGGSGTVTVQADNSGTLIKSSDSSLKQEDKEYKIQGLAEILQLQPRAYKWLKDIEVRKEQAVTEIGFFADEVNPIIPSAAPKGFDGLYGFNDRAVMAALVKSIQEQQAQIEELKAEFDEYKTTHP